MCLKDGILIFETKNHLWLLFSSAGTIGNIRTTILLLCLSLYGHPKVIMVSIQKNNDLLYTHMNSSHALILLPRNGQYAVPLKYLQHTSYNINSYYLNLQYFFDFVRWYLVLAFVKYILVLHFYIFFRKLKWSLRAFYCHQMYFVHNINSLITFNVCMGVLYCMPA